MTKHYSMTRVRSEAMIVEVWMPGERREIEFLDDVN
jgi:hypothetical protein